MKRKRHKKIKYDIHFWLGKTTTQDEAGTAAYKTVELDDFFGGDPIQHRECSGFESSLFLSYFKSIKLLSGGVDSGFNHVKPESYTPRLLWVKGRKKVRTVEVDIALKNLNSGDVFILDAGLLLLQYQGKAAGKHEKRHGGVLAQSIDDERKGKPEKEVFSQVDKPSDDSMRKFFSYFEADIKELNDSKEEVKAGEPVSEDLSKKMLAKIPEGEGGDDVEFEKDTKKSLHQLSDSGGTLKFTEVAKGGDCKKKLLKSEDVFIFDIGCEIFVWIGKGASKNERSQAMSYASQYMKKNERPMQMPVTQVFEGGENEVFENALYK